MSNISALRALAEFNKVEASGNENAEVASPEKKTKFSLFGFGFISSRVDDIPPEEKGFDIKS